ncbi:MAG TPA: hypothetical protein VGZ25_08530, partial [Gemmataceae bacterium]|nr:hypothetical protein [Gemmataceae bacterium]
MPQIHKNYGLLLLRHLSTHGLIALLVAVVSLVLLRGLSLGLVLMFGLPPTVAAFLTQANVSRAGRWIAWSFLAMVGLGSIVARVQPLFPKLGGFAPQLDPWHDRMLSWYAAVYVVWFASVVPITAFS